MAQASVIENSGSNKKKINGAYFSLMAMAMVRCGRMAVLLAPPWDVFSPQKSLLDNSRKAGGKNTTPSRKEGLPWPDQKNQISNLKSKNAWGRMRSRILRLLDKLRLLDIYRAGFGFQE